ncbi:MAG: VOC family protein [Lachnospiraceae bacterium]|nr:VOC family protein [Lachnospiraceae bacterium]
MKIHHIGYLVKKMDKSLPVFAELGYEVEKEPVYDEYRKADIAFLIMDGYRIELVCPHKESDVYPLLKKFGNSPYHICYETEDQERDISRLRDSGYTDFTGIQPAPAIGEQAEVVFFIHSRMGIIELLKV